MEVAGTTSDVVTSWTRQGASRSDEKNLNAVIQYARIYDQRSDDE